MGLVKLIHPTYRRSPHFVLELFIKNIVRQFFDFASKTCTSKYIVYLNLVYFTT